jgi:hypothetical protein
VAGVVVTFTDITSSKNLEAALRKAQMESDKKFQDQKAESEQKPD